MTIDKHTRDFLKSACYILFIIFFIAALAVAGQSDYEDAVLCEMKNNGLYWELADRHPELSNSELVKLYMEEREALLGSGD